MAEYIAAIFEDQGGFGVVFPDFPGCVSQGETLEGARVMAEEALGLHIKGMLADGEALPRPLGLDLARAHELCEGASAFIAVRAPGLKAARVTITVQVDDLKAIDAYAREHGMARSAFLVRAAKETMQRA